MKPTVRSVRKLYFDNPRGLLCRFTGNTHYAIWRVCFESGTEHYYCDEHLPAKHRAAMEAK